MCKNGIMTIIKTTIKLFSVKFGLFNISPPHRGAFSRMSNQSYLQGHLHDVIKLRRTVLNKNVISPFHR